jgi:uncharacterized protein (DUF433 family)
MVEAVIRGTRITVDLVIDLLAQGWREQDLLAPTRISPREDILRGCFV